MRVLTTIRHMAGRAALAGVGCALAFLLLEICIRFFGIGYPLFTTWDPQIGFVLLPGAEGWFRQEGEAYIRINSHGMRDREHATAKAPGVFRIAVLGDSYAEALQVPVEKTFWAGVERHLATCPALQGRAIEVLNFGVSGFGTVQELLMWRHRASAFTPDLVLLAITTGNDIRDNARALAQDPLKPYFTLQGGELVLDDSYKQLPAAVARQTWRYHAWQALSQRVRLLQIANRARQIVELRSRPVPASALSKQAQQGQEAGLDSGVYLEPTDLIWEEAWRVTERIIVQLRDDVAAKGSRLHVATLSSGIQVHPDRRVREETERQLGVTSLFYPDERIASLGRREAISVTTLAPSLRAAAEQGQLPVHGFGATLGQGHWNEHGHREAGRMIARDLCAELGGGS